jgi:hypothetical protein
MEKSSKHKKSRTDHLKKLAQTVAGCASPDVYFAQNDRLQQFDSLPCEPGSYMCIAPEQMFTLARIENHNILRHRSSS